MCARIGAGVSPFISQLLGEAWLPLPAIIFGSASFIAAAFLPILPDTSGAVLPESIFDSEKATSGENFWTRFLRSAGVEKSESRVTLPSVEIKASFSAMGADNAGFDRRE